MKHFFISSLLMMNTFLLFSQSNGIILNSDGTPLEGVTVLIADQNILLKTNELGEFFFESKLPNNSYLNFYKNGYVSKLVKYKEGN
jgi:hypothetical protein